jgi:hypothetical protein
LGEFIYEPLPGDDGVKRVVRQLFTMENGNKYMGEWNVKTN